MNPKRRHSQKDDAQNFTDRCALAFLSALMAFLSGTLLWLVLFYLLGLRGGLAIPTASFYLVWLFTIVMALLGFLRKENLGLSVLGKIWQVLYGIWRIFTWPRRMRW